MFNSSYTLDLINIGIYAESVLYPRLVMPQAIDAILSRDDLNLTFALPSVPDARNKLLDLQMMLPTLPYDNGTVQMVTEYTVLTVITTLAVGGRFYARRCLLKDVRKEDWVALLTLLLNLLVAINYTLSATIGGSGHHIYDVTFKTYERVILMIGISECAFLVAMTSTKLVFLIFYYSLCPETGYRRQLMAVGAFIILLSGMGGLLAIFQCQPYNPFIYGGYNQKCINRTAAFSTWGALTVVSDFMVLILPISKVMKLRLKRNEKFLVVGIFAAGGLVCIASVARVVTFNYVFTSVDNIRPIRLWSLVELDLSLIISCLPALRHLYAHWRRSKVSNNLEMLIIRSNNAKRKPSKGLGSENITTGAVSTAPTSSTLSIKPIRTRAELEATINEDKSRDIEVSSQEIDATVSDIDEDPTDLESGRPAEEKKKGALDV